MGIFHRDDGTDAKFIKSAALGFVYHYNTATNLGGDRRIAVVEPCVEAVTRTGGLILGLPCFPERPNKYKQLGALVVLGCMRPIYTFQHSGTDGHWHNSYVTQDDVEGHRWLLAKLLVAMAAALYPYILNGEGPGEPPLLESSDFSDGNLNASDEYLDEFLRFLVWIGNSDCFQTTADKSRVHDVDQLRTARIIQGTALILRSIIE